MVAGRTKIFSLDPTFDRLGLSKTYNTCHIATKLHRMFPDSCTNILSVNML